MKLQFIIYVTLTISALVNAKESARDTDACKTPVKASRETCKAEKVNALDMACRMQLTKACFEAGMDFVKSADEGNDAKNCKTPVKASRETCKAEKANALDMACRMQLTKACFEAGMDFVKSADEGNNAKNCKTPVKASRETCKAEKANALDMACRMQLTKACFEAGMDLHDPFKGKDCDAVKASKNTCTGAGLKNILTTKPQCVLKLKQMCREQQDATPTSLIPDGCVKWFDGCNNCTVAQGKPAGCTKKFCRSPKRPYCAAYADKRACQMSRATGKVACKKPDAPAAKPAAKTCDSITSDLDLSDEDTCRKAMYLCAGKPAIVSACKAKKQQDEKEQCKSVESDSRKAKCCVQGHLEGATCKEFGGRDSLPDYCQTRCFADGKFKRDERTCVRCRGKGQLRAKDKDGKSDAKADKRPFDPARVNETIKDIGSKLNENGKACIKRVARATATLKVRLNRWRKNNSTKKEEPEEETELKSLAEVQTDLEEAIEESKNVEDEFSEDDDDEGKDFREKLDSEGERLKNKMTDSSKPKNQQCRAAFEALRDSFNDVVDKYSKLPAKLKSEGIKRVKFPFSDTDIGRADLEDSKSVCAFASKYVPQLKKAETNHKARLAAARKLLCTKAGELLKNKRISELTNCLRKAKRDAKDDDAKRDADADAQNFDQHARKHVQKLVALMKKKCVMRDNADSALAAVAKLFTGKLKTRISKKAGGALTEADREKIANTMNDEVKKTFPSATDIATTIEDDGQRRQLRDRRGLASAVQVETTWSLDDAPSAATASLDLGQLGDEFESSVPDITTEPTDASVEVTEPIEPINDQLPADTDDNTGKPDTSSPDDNTGKPDTSSPDDNTGKPDTSSPDDDKQVSAGMTQVAVGATTVMCTTLFSVLL